MVVVFAKRARAKLLVETRAASDQASGAVERQADSSGSVKKSAVLAAVVLASGRLAGAYQRVLAEARRGARQEGVVRLADDLGHVGLPDADLVLRVGHRAEEDAHLALVAGQSLAAQWQGIAAHEAQSSLRTGKSVGASLQRATRVLAPRVERTSVTEVSTAFNEERLLSLREALERDRAFAASFWERRLMRRWDAQLEACEDCADHDGEVTGIDEAFDGGDEPGHMHPRCLCVDTIVEA